MISEISIDSIIETNVAKDREGLQVDSSIIALAKSIKQNGLIHPIIVKKISEEQYRIVCGQRRLLACKLLNLTTIQAIEKSYASEKEELISILHENLMRKDINSYDDFFLKISLLYIHTLPTLSDSRNDGETQLLKENAIDYIKSICSIYIRNANISPSNSELEKLNEFNANCQLLSISPKTLLNNFFFFELNDDIVKILKENKLTIFVAREIYKLRKWEHIEELYSFLVKRAKDNQLKIKVSEIKSFVQMKTKQKREAEKKEDFSVEILINNIKKLDFKDELKFLRKINRQIEKNISKKKEKNNENS